MSSLEQTLVTSKREAKHTKMEFEKFTHQSQQREAMLTQQLSEKSDELNLMKRECEMASEQVRILFFLYESCF